MKTIKRRLLSLVLAMAMVLTLAPGALATGETLTLNDTSLSLKVDETATLSVTGVSNSNGPITGQDTSATQWSSSAETVATVSNGVVTAKAVGTATITATLTLTGNDTATYTGTCTVTVSAKDTTVPVTKVTVSPSTATLAPGGSTNLTATVEPSNATTPGVEWTSSDSTKATVGTNGKVTILSGATGSVTITATSKGTDASGSRKTGTCTITISTPTADKVVLSGTGVTGGTNNSYALTMTAGKTASVTAQLKDSAGQNMSGAATVDGGSAGICTGTISNNTITLTAGTVTKNETATFTVSCGGKTATLVVTVTPAPQTITANLSAPAPSSIYHSGPGAATVLTTVGDTTGYTLSWDISPANYVSVTKADNNTSVLTGTYNISALTTVNEPRTVTIQAKLSKQGSADVRSNSVTLTVNPYNTLVLSPTAGTPSTSNIVYLNNWTGNSNAEWMDFAVGATWYQGGISQPIGTGSITYAWTLNGSPMTNSYTSSFRLYSSTYGLKYGNQDNTLTCTARLTSENNVTATNSISWTIRTGYTANALASATVSTSTSSYALGDVDDAGKSSIVSQLDSYFYNKTGYYGLAYVQFTGSLQNNTYGSLSARSGVNYYADRRSGTGTSSSYLSDVLFYPGNTKGTVTFPIRAYYYTSNMLNTTNWTDGSITFNVTEGVSSSGDITYTADLGKDVAFDLRDFEDYYYNKTRGTLSYVTFTLPSGGTLYYDGGRLPSSNSCYASPSRTQIDLAGIYFTPTGTTATRPGSVRINFTAYGSRNYSGGTSGTVVINYLSGSAKDITYTPSGKSVSLRASDFTEAYRQAVGSTAPSGLTIQFQDVPSYGTLTYKDSSRSNSSTVTLRSSNIKNYKFTTRSSGSNQLADVTYTPSGSRNESITYIAYNGNTPQFTGKVVFNPTVVDNNMSVTFTGGQTITLDYQRFVQANASVMSSTTRIRFMSLPVYGTLTYNGATVSAAGTDIVPSLLGNVVYRSSSATTVTDKVVFTCYNAAGDVVGGGQVNLNSTGTGGNNGGVTNISQFKDVNPNAWYASDLSILLSRGIMQGKLEGKFDPLGQLKYGEALKIFLLSAGYSAQEGTGKDWAAGYKTLAVNNGWISSDVDLDAKITRNAMAELAAKVLGLSATSSVPSTWKDGTSNGYANALYYTSPQILVGNADGTFKGNDTLQRQEICKIAARVLNYKSNQQSSQLPGWLS